MGSVRTLVVDDDDLTRELLAHVLRKDGHEVVEVSDGADALTRLGSARFDLVVSDVQMARTSGIELLEAIAKLPVRPPVILVTGYAEAAAAMDAMALGAADYLSKPVDPEQLLALMRLDKKNLAGTLRLILWRGVGRAEIISGVNETDVMAVLRAATR